MENNQDSIGKYEEYLKEKNRKENEQKKSFENINNQEPNNHSENSFGNNKGYTKKSKSGLFTGLIIGMIFAIILFSLILVALMVSKNGLPIKNHDVAKIETTSTQTDKSKDLDVNQIYQDSVDSVVSVINLQKISTGSSILDQYLQQQQETNESGEQEAGTGSGFVYKKENGYYYAVTNNHVVEDSDDIEIVLNSTDLEKDEPIKAEIIGVDTAYDLAVIKFKSSKDITPLKFSNSDEIYPGQQVMAIGSPYGVDFQGSVTEGIISAPIRTSTDTSGNELSYIQTDTAINPGNSGGPLLNSDGEVVGINSMKIAETSSDNMGFAIPSNTIVEIINQIESGSQLYDNASK